MPQNIHARLVDSDPPNDGQRRIKQYFLQNLTRLRSLSFDEIAVATQTSQPTVTRFVRRLGYENSLDFRAACVTHPPDGRLSPTEVQKAAELIWSKNSLMLYGAPNITRATARFLALDWSSVGPRIQDSHAAQSQGGNDNFLITTMSERPSVDVEMVLQRANDTKSRAVILKAVDFVVEGATEDVLQLSLHLDPKLDRQVRATYLLSAIADIWRCGQRLTLQ